MLRNKCQWHQWVPIPLRLVKGYGFLTHRWAKWSRGPEGFYKLHQQLGVPCPEFTAWLVTLLELFGGIAVLAGAFVAVVNVPLMLSMLVAMFKAHFQYGFSSINTIGSAKAGPVFGPPGYEVNFLYIAGLLVLMSHSMAGWHAEGKYRSAQVEPRAPDRCCIQYIAAKPVVPRGAVTLGSKKD